MFKRLKTISIIVSLLMVFTAGAANQAFAREYNETIEGASVLTSRQMGDFVLLHNPNPLLTEVNIYQLADLYLNLGRVEGIRGDIAFAQAIKETGYFQYGGDVLPEQNNYSGIGTTGNGVKGYFFQSPEEGVRAQIQHLKAYGSTEPLVTELADPRFNLVKRGIAPKWIDLNGRWAVPGNNYGEDILSLYDQMQAITLSIPNVELPANHKLPVAMLTLRQSADMLAPDGSFYKRLEKGQYRVYGVLGNNYNIGGGYLVKANSSKMSVYIGWILIKENTPLYSPDSKVSRTLEKGELIRVYSYDDQRYDVGGGYYVKKTSSQTYYLGLATLKADTVMYDKNGNPYKTLKKNTSYRVFTINQNKLDIGGGYYIMYDKNTVNYRN